MPTGTQSRATIHTAIPLSEVAVGAPEELRPSISRYFGEGEILNTLLHPLIRSLVKTREEAQRREVADGRALQFRTPPWSACEQRRLKIISKIFSAVETDGIVPGLGRNNDIHFGFRDEKIVCSLREICRRRRGSIVDHAQSGFGLHLRQRNLIPTGVLAFQFYSHLGAMSGLRREWIETSSRPFEELIPEIVEAIRRAGPALIKRREEQEDELRLHKEAYLARRNESERQRREQDQWRTLVKFAEHMEAAERVRTLLAALGNGIADRSKLFGDRTVEEWLVWVRTYLEKFDPLSRVESILHEVSNPPDRAGGKKE